MELVGLNAMEAAAYTSTRIISDTEEFLGLADIWNKLLKRSKISNIYLSHEWLYTWWRRFARERTNELFIVCVYTENVLVAIAPFYIQRKTGYRIGFKNTLRLLGQSIGQDTMPCTEQLDIIVDQRREHQGLVYKVLFDLLKQAGRWSQYYFQRLNMHSMLFKLHADLARTRHDSRHNLHAALKLELPDSFDEFLAQQTRNWRSTYRGYRKIMHLSGTPEIRLMNRPEEIHSGLQSLSQIMCAQQRKSTDGRCLYDSDQFMGFHEDICHLMSIEGRVLIATLLLDSRLLGAVYLFESEDVLQVHQLASVTGDGIRFCPAKMLMTKVVEYAIQRGKSRIVFRSNCKGLNLQGEIARGEYIQLYNLEWYKNRRRAYIVRSARKLCLALRASSR